MNSIPIIPKPYSIVTGEGSVSAEKLTAPTIRHEDGMVSESYVLDVTADGATIVCGDKSGEFYAGITLKQLLRLYKNLVPVMRISDKPLQAYRGFMLDCARYFFSVDEVKRVLDICAELKLNVFHWHLTDDQGWRPYIDAYPRLCEVGSTRRRSLYSWKPHHGYYTKDDMREIVEYAHARHIRVIPEIDIPAHTRSAIAAYPALMCFPRKLPVPVKWGVKHDVLCAGKETTYSFLSTVIDELTEIFTDGFFHLGGDEALPLRWRTCPDCAKRMAAEGLKDEEELFVHFINRVAEDCILTKGITPIMWSYGKPHDGLDKRIALQQYGEKISSTAEEHADTKAVTIRSDSDVLYYDLPYSLIPLTKAYEGIKANTDSIGTEMCLWAEYIPDYRTLMKKTFPRILAAAENAWSLNKDTYAEFEQRAVEYYRTCEDTRFYTPIGKTNPRGLTAKAQTLWWARRPLHWAGLSNLLGDLHVNTLKKRREKTR